jgi:hypothetical protein
MSALQTHLENSHRSPVIVKFSIGDFTILDFTISASRTADNREVTS